MNAFDRRNQARVSMIETGMIYGTNLRLYCSTLDVCLNGMALASTERRDPGDFLRVAWSIGDGDPVEIEGVVVHADRQAQGTWLLGVRFVGMSDDARRAIFQHIRGQALGRRQSRSLRQTGAIRP